MIADGRRRLRDLAQRVDDLEEQLRGAGAGALERRGRELARPQDALAYRPPRVRWTPRRMSPFNTNTYSESKPFEKTRFLQTSLGQHTIRILIFKEMFTHYLPMTNSSVACLAEECPICHDNKKLMAEHPEDFRKTPGWLPRQLKHYMNVLDRTLVKICPNCQAENKRGVSGQFSATCVECNTFLPQDLKPIPSDKVKVLSISDTNAQRLNTQEASNLDKDGNSIPFTSCDVIVTVSMLKDKKDIWRFRPGDRCE